MSVAHIKANRMSQQPARWRAFLNYSGFARRLFVSSCSQIFSAEALFRSVRETAERIAFNANARELPIIHADPISI
jgi:hypothetical protein